MEWIKRLFALLFLIGMFTVWPIVSKNRWIQSTVFLLMGVLLIWMAAERTYKNHLLRESAENIRAIITRKTITRKRRGHSYNVYLEYRLPSDGTVHTDHKTFSRSTYQQINIGDTINLMVATEDPSVTILEQSYPPSRYPSFLLVMLIIFLFSIGILNLYLNKPNTGKS